MHMSEAKHQFISVGFVSQTTAPGSLLHGEAFSDRKAFFLSDPCVC